MPLGSKKSRAAKYTCQNARTAFATLALHTASSDSSEYLGSDSGSDSSVIDVESDDEVNKRAGNGVESAVEAI